MIKATALTAELAAKRAAERAKFDGLSLEQSGRGAETLYRDKATGKKMTAEELKAKREVRQSASRRACQKDSVRLGLGAGGYAVQSQGGRPTVGIGTGGLRPPGASSSKSSAPATFGSLLLSVAPSGVECESRWRAC